MELSFYRNALVHRLFVALSAILLLTSCSGDDEGNGVSLSDSPQALAQYDSSNYGLYKGIFVGSSGVVEVNINNDGEVSAMMVVDGSKYNFSTSETITLGEPIENLTFIGGNRSFDFSVTETGQNPQISNIDFDGHENPVTEIVKEYSTLHVKCFQGTFSGDDSGVFNMVQIGENFYGIARTQGTAESRWINAQISGTAITGEFDGGTFSGALNGNTLEGTWVNTLAETGSWTGRRKL